MPLVRAISQRLSRRVITLLERFLRSVEPVSTARPSVRGKFLFVGKEKLYVKGVTYGPFAPEPDGSEYHTPDVVSADMARMAASGINTIRTYTVPPRWLLDLASQHKLRVMVGLPWEQHLAFLDDPTRRRDIERRVAEGVRQCAGHPAVLAYAVGNEIPSGIVRWYGRRRTERFIKRLYDVAKAHDPEGLFTYVNYPTTEYLQLPFIDFVCFNVYLESLPKYQAYLARLHNIAGDRPLVMAEIGLDSRCNGEAEQALALDWQVRSSFAGGCAGVFLFTWTDEWFRGGEEVTGWAFGLTRRDRSPKIALEWVQRALADVPFPRTMVWPKISVVVCTYNGSRTIRNCCEGLLQLQYPNVEVIVVNDGSRDSTPAIAREFGFRVIDTENRGLSSARNTGLEAATGEIVAYLDDDACPDPHWLHYLAASFMKSNHVGIGGPNIPPAGDGLIADCVANAPGGPIHVLLTDELAEHLPGCNMAFRRSALLEISGFDASFRVAGDDVDLCWRLQERGGTLGFSPAAMVWHHRRNSTRMFWRQQKGYGKAEAMLERKWPQKYNVVGHHSWSGRIYGQGMTHSLGIQRSRLYQGMWGLAPFQALYQSQPGTLGLLPLMPEWYLIVGTLAGLTALGDLWPPLLMFFPLLSLAVAATLVQAALSSSYATFRLPLHMRRERAVRYLLTTYLHLMQPLARLCGRIEHGLTPWRRQPLHGLKMPRFREYRLWSDKWQAAEDRLRHIEHSLHRLVATVRGGDFDAWDLELRGGMLGALRLCLAIEEHGSGKQLVHIRLLPRFSIIGLTATALLGMLSLAAFLDDAWVVGTVLGLIMLRLLWRTILECALVSAFVSRTLHTGRHGTIMR